MRRCITLLLLTTGLLLANEGRAQTYNISWYKIAGGGGTSSSTNGYTLSGTIGQPDAGTMSGGAYSLTGGFWGMIATVQTLGSPFLSIHTTNSHTAVLSWNASPNGYMLQQISALTSTNWSTLNTNTYPVTVSNGTNYVSLPISGGNQYFRLVNP
jgi:hypothetical protein